MDLTELTTAISALEERAKTAVERAEAGDASVEEAKAMIEAVKPELDNLKRDREDALAAKGLEDLRGEMTTLSEAVAKLQAPIGEFTLPTDESGKALGDDDPYAHGRSVFGDVRMAARGDVAARDRLTQGFEGLNSEGKAMTEGTANQGGYLVRPQIERQLVEAKELDNVLRGLCSSINVTTNAIQLDQLGLATTAGWVEELQTKPESTGMTLATVVANVFTAAGLATISNQLLVDSNPAVDGLATRDLAKRLVALEETAFLAGDGTGKPLGILNTPGLGATTYTEGTPTVAALLANILTSIGKVEDAWGAPTAILMHPRTWTRILKSTDAQGAYLIDPTGGVQDPRTGFRGPVKTLWGYRVVTTNRMPTNLGSGTNESRVIVGDFSEALILDRQGITVDVSPHVYFTTNQTVFRAEERVGFTAARSPAAFDIIGGTGLAAG